MTDKHKSSIKLNSSALIPVNPAIEEYMRVLLSHTDHPALLEMETLAQKNNFPIVGRLAGVFLETMAKMVNARRVFEFGSGYGYSAYWFAKAVGLTGQVICSEADLLNREKAEHYLSSAGLWDRIDFRAGMAQDIFARTVGLFDICYNSMFKFLNFLHTDPLRITQQFGTVAKPPVPSSLNLSQPYACQKALAEKHRQSGPPVL